jgi:hypothetical protein
MKARVEVPPVHLVNRSHPPAPARIGVVRKPLPGRLALTLLSLAAFWGPIPWLVWVPPHYPWPILAVCAGAFLAHRFWHGRFVVRYFAGPCPRCGRHLRIAAGERIDLPHLVTCFGCHFESLLEVYRDEDEERIAAEPGRGIRHVLPDCAGTWREERLWDQPFVACAGCGARHHGSSIGRAPVSKTGGWGFDSLLPC